MKKEYSNIKYIAPDVDVTAFRNEYVLCTSETGTLESFEEDTWLW